MADKTTERLAGAALPILIGLGYDLADLELVKEGANWYLRFYIERADGSGSADLEDCQKASEALSDWLDEADPIPQAYFLEVSSPGIERQLKREKDFRRFAGQKVRVALFAPWQGEKNRVGSLGEVTSDSLGLVDENGESLKIPRELIARVNLYWDGYEEG